MKFASGIIKAEEQQGFLSYTEKSWGEPHINYPQPVSELRSRGKHLLYTVMLNNVSERMRFCLTKGHF